MGKVELNEHGFMHKMNYIEISLQDKEDTENAIEYNKQENYEYRFVARNLINTEYLVMFLSNGYEVIRIFDDMLKNDCICLVHKSKLEK